MEIKITPRLGIDVQTVMTGRGCIIGQSGSGKSYLVGTIAEKLSGLGLPYCIIDTEGEYSSLNDHFNAVIVGGENQNFGFDRDLSKLFEQCIRDGVPVMLDISDELNKKDIVYRALEEIYAVEERLRLPYLILIEEADKFVPQVTHKSMNIIEELGVRGRKRGIGLIVATQRPSTISKNLLSQCSYGFIGKLTIGNDLKAIQQLFSNKKKLDEIVNLSIGEFIPFGIGSNEKFRLDITNVSKKGSTPVVDAKAGSAKPELGELIRRLKSNQVLARRNVTSKSGKRIYALSLKFSNHDAHGYSRKVARRRFGIFGPAIERPESIKIRYIAAGLCKIRIPTKRRNEFEEYYFLMDRNFKLIKFSNGIVFENDGISKPFKLDDFEARLLDEIRSKKRVPIEKLGRIIKGNDRHIRDAIKSLLGHKLITSDSRNLYAKNYSSYLLRNNPETEVIHVPSDQVNDDKITKEKARLYVNNLYPNATIVSMSTVYIPIHEIVLRYKNKIRIFKVDGIYGREIITNANG